MNEVALGLHHIVLRLVELGNGSLAVLVFRLSEVEGILACHLCLKTALVLCLGSNSVVIYLLYFLVERFLHIIEGELLVLLVDRS